MLFRRKKGADDAPADEGGFAVAEHFTSIDGEGLHAGRLAFFVRFSGCNLRCLWCDTKWANSPACPVQDMSASRICELVRSSGARCVTLTGGEPMMQPDVLALVESLAGMDEVDVVEIETNGSILLDDLAALRRRLEDEGAEGAEGAEGDFPAGDGFDPARPSEVACVGTSPTPAVNLPCSNEARERAREAGATHFAGDGAKIVITMDYKLPMSGSEHHMIASNRSLLGPLDAVKFVIGGEIDLLRCADVISEYGLEERTNVLLSPVAGKMEPSGIVEFMKERDLSRARLQLQLHKIIWPGVEKGV